MCGRYTLRRPRRVKLEGLDDNELFPVLPRYNIAPSQEVLTVREISEKRFFSTLHWGLIPSWSEKPVGFINARAETLQTKPSFREAFQRRRCLIPADGFYEWEKLGKERRPYYFQMKNEAPFCFAGIWDEWKKDAASITSCAIITTTPNEMLASIHDRMPVILRSEDQDMWLRGSAKLKDLKNLLVPFSANEMKSHPVSSDVNRPRIDDEHLVRPVEPNLGVTPSLF